MNKKAKDIDDMIFRLRSLNAVIGILATVTCEGTKSVEFDPETLADALYSITHSVDTIIDDLDETSKDALNVKIAPRTMQMLGRIVDVERRCQKGGNDHELYDSLLPYASRLLTEAIGWKYAQLFEATNEEPELSDEELDALGIPIVCVRK